MERRTIVRLLAGAALWNSSAGAQKADRARVIGVMMLNDVSDPEGKERLMSFRRSLRDLGWGDGEVRLDVRWYGGEPDRARAFARELVERSPDVIVANGTLAAAAVKELTSSIPVVFVVVTDPVGTGFVVSLPQPGGNMTGFSTFEPEIGGKWVEILLELVPSIKRVAVLTDREFRGFTQIWRVIDGAAPLHGLRAVALNLHSGTEIGAAVREFSSEQDGGLIVLPTSTNAAHRKLIVELAAERRLPAIYPFSYYARGGGLISYGFDAADLFRRAAPYVARILRGELPGNLPVQAPTKFELILNQPTARALGLAVSPALLAKVDEVIE